MVAVGLPATVKLHMPTARYIDSLKNPRIPGFVWQDPENDDDSKMFRDILEFGFQTIQIEAEEGSAEYSFSVGLYLNFLHPEILIMGVSGDVCHRAIHRICSQVTSGSIINAGDERSDLFDLAYPVRFASVDEKFYFDYIGYAAWFYRSTLFKAPRVGQHKFPVLQALWADKNGFYPDDPRCDETARRVQTLVEVLDSTK